MTGGTALASFLCEAAGWRLLGLLLERPRGGWHDEVNRLAAEVTDSDLAAAAAAAAGTTEGRYLAVLGPGGTVSPREVAYQGLEDPGAILADVSAFYRAFAFTPRAEEPADHVAVEAGFVGYLHLKSAYARARDDAEGAQVCVDAAGRFIAAHLGAVAAALAERLAVAGHGAPHLALAARALATRTVAARSVAARSVDAQAGAACRPPVT